MKKLIAIFLILFTLLLTACNNQHLDTTASTGTTEDTESTNFSQTTVSTGASQTTSSSATEETTKKNLEKPIEVNGYIVPEKLRDKIIFSQMGTFLDF